MILGVFLLPWVHGCSETAVSTSMALIAEEGTPYTLPLATVLYCLLSTFLTLPQLSGPA
jgi:hypothetical protein